MKKLVSIIFLLIIIFASKNVKAQDQPCPDGYSEVRTTLYIGACPYEVKVCYKCDATTWTTIQLWGFMKMDPNCDPGLDFNQTFAALASQIYTKDFVDKICGDQEVPPCEPYNAGIWWQEWYFGCWQKYNYPGYGIVYHRCWDVNQRVCIQYKKLCWDAQNQVYRTDVMDYTWYVDDGSCSTSSTEPPDPPSGQESDCWYVKTPCEL